MTATPGWATNDSMSEEKIVEVVNEALAAAGIEDTVTAAGGFEPRGHSGAGFAGGLIGGGDIGDVIGSPAGGIGTVGMRLPITRAKDVIQELTWRPWLPAQHEGPVGTPPPEL